MTLPFAKITDAAPARAGDEVSSTLFNDYLVDGGDTYFRALKWLPEYRAGRRHHSGAQAYSGMGRPSPGRW